LQDLLNLGGEARMNVPGRADGNWRWRTTEETLAPDAFQRLRELTESTERSAAPEAPAVSQPGVIGPENLATGLMKTASH